MTHAGYFNDRELLSIEEMLAQTRSRLAAQLRYVAATSPFYERKWGTEATRELACMSPETVDDLLAELPFTEKDELRQAQEDAPPFGDYLACPPGEVVRVHRTSGTTGRPLLIAHTAADVLVTQTHGSQALWCAGVRPTDVVVHCLNYCMWSGGLTDHLCLESTGATVIPFGSGNTDLLLALPRWLPISVISCTPSYVSLILERLRDEDEDRIRWAANLRLVLVGGEPGGSNPALKHAVEAAFGAQLVDGNYGLAEVLSIFAAACPAEAGFHFHGQRALWPEFVDPANGALLTPTDGLTAELVFTHAQRRAQPLVRYRTGDLVEILSTGVCECRRRSMRFRLRGRADDMFVVRGVNVFPSAIADILSSVSSDLREFAVTLTHSAPYDFVPLRVEVPAGAPSEVRLAIADEMKRTLGCRAEVELVPQGTLPRSEGKVQRVYRDGSSS